MRFTEYGMRLAHMEEPIEDGAIPLNQEAARQFLKEVDRGKLVLVTGGNDTAAGRNLRITCMSVVAAFAYAETDRHIRFAWHLRNDGTRRLVFRS